MYFQYGDDLSSSVYLWGRLSKGGYEARMTSTTSDELYFIHRFPGQSIFISWMMTILANVPFQDGIQQWYNHL